MSVKIVYEDIAAGAAEAVSAASRYAAEFSVLERLSVGGSGAAIATMEPGNWVLDGTREILDGQPLAFWSREMSEADGAFNAPPVLTFTFKNRYTSPGLALRFDAGTGDFCTRLAVEWYRGEELLAREEFRPDGVEFFCGRAVEAFDKLILRFYETSRPFRYAKVQHVRFGITRTFLRPELRSVRVTQEASAVSAQVAVNTLDFTLDSRGDVAYMFQTKQPVSVYDGNRLIGVFYIEDAKRRGKGLYDVSCKDAVGILDRDAFPGGMYRDYPAKQLLLDILGGKFDLELDPSLEEYPMTGYLPESSRREALQQAAFAMGAMVDTSGTDKILVHRLWGGVPRRIPDGRVYAAGNAVTTSAAVTAVQVTSHRYSTTGKGTDTVEVDGVTYYHTTNVTTIANPTVTAADKPNVVVVDKATLVHEGNVDAVARRLYSYCAMRRKQRVRIVLDGERPGDWVLAPTPWGGAVEGVLTSLRVVLSGTAAAECEIAGEELETGGTPERFMIGEIQTGEASAWED